MWLDWDQKYCEPRPLRLYPAGVLGPGNSNSKIFEDRNAWHSILSCFLIWIFNILSVITKSLRKCWLHMTICVQGVWGNQKGCLVMGRCWEEGRLQGQEEELRPSGRPWRAQPMFSRLLKNPTSFWIHTSRSKEVPLTRCISFVSAQAERGWICLSSPFLFHLGPLQIGWCPPRWEGPSAVLSSPIQMLIQPRNTLTDIPSVLPLKNSVSPAIWASLRPVKLTHQINQHRPVWTGFLLLLQEGILTGSGFGDSKVLGREWWGSAA